MAFQDCTDGRSSSNHTLDSRQDSEGRRYTVILSAAVAPKFCPNLKQTMLDSNLKVYFYLNSVFMYELDGAMGCPGIWLNIICSYSCNCVSRWDKDLVNWVKHISLHTVGGQHPNHCGPGKDKMMEKGSVCYLCLSD